MPAYEMVPEESKLKFVALQNSAPVEGAFKKFTTEIRFDPNNLDNSSIRADVDMASVFTEYPEVATNLVGTDWFDVKKFPKASFRTLQIKNLPARDNDDRLYYYADAELTLRDKTVPVTINFILERLDANGAVASGRVSLKRREFGVGQGDWAKTDTVDDVVSVSFRVVAKRV